jgi:predicted HicB family RNase H-like nuclease
MAPARGYKKPDGRGRLLQVRVTDDQHTAYELAAERAGYSSMSAWVRSVLDAVAGAARPADDD